MNATTDELDYEGASGETPFTYDGEGGIQLGGYLPARALRVALPGREPADLRAGHSDSRILIDRDIETRAEDTMPFLTFDHDPYFAVTSKGVRLDLGRVHRRPTSTPTRRRSTSPRRRPTSSPRQEVNYMRNSVKAVVDAYDGSVTYYADLDEPIMQAWDRAFPGLFTPIDDAPDELRAHFRYPENLFQAQAFQFANYHVQDPAAFYRKQDFWEVPSDPTLQSASTRSAAPRRRPPSRARGSCSRTTSSCGCPGEAEERFHLVIPFQPENRLNMVGWMAANSDPDGYGELVAFTFPAGRDVDGPGLVFARDELRTRSSRRRGRCWTGRVDRCCSATC